MDKFKNLYNLMIKLAPAIVAICSVLSNVVPHEEGTTEWVKLIHELLDTVALNNHQHHDELTLCWKDE